MQCSDSAMTMHMTATWALRFACVQINESISIKRIIHVAANPKLTITADFALTSFCRVAVVVNDRSEQLAKTDRF